MPMQPIEYGEGLEVIYDGEPWVIWSIGSDSNKVWLLSMEHGPDQMVEVDRADCERAPLPPAEMDQPLFDMSEGT